MLPKVEREKAVLIINLSPKPYLKLTDDDVRALLKLDTRIAGVIFDNQADWFAFYDEAMAMRLAHENYEASLLGGGEK